MKENNYKRISFKISKDLLKEFDEHSKKKGYQRRDTAIIELIESELTSY
jgi:metal-responsive CopG/Arc/MetJ family transcriptional regulator